MSAGSRPVLAVCRLFANIFIPTLCHCFEIVILPPPAIERVSRAPPLPGGTPARPTSPHRPAGTGAALCCSVPGPASPCAATDRPARRVPRPQSRSPARLRPHLATTPRSAPSSSRRSAVRVISRTTCAADGLPEDTPLDDDDNDHHDDGPPSVGIPTASVVGIRRPATPWGLQQDSRRTLAISVLSP